jgi:hypothetical protein
MPCCSKNKVKVFEIKVFEVKVFSKPFQKPYMGDFDRVKIHTEFEGGLFSTIFIISRQFHRSKKSLLKILANS